MGSGGRVPTSPAPVPLPTRVGLAPGQVWGGSRSCGQRPHPEVGGADDAFVLPDLRAQSAARGVCSLLQPAPAPDPERLGRRVEPASRPSPTSAARRHGSMSACGPALGLLLLLLCPAQVSGRRRPGQAVGDVVRPRGGKGGGLCSGSGALGPREDQPRVQRVPGKLV